MDYERCSSQGWALAYAELPRGLQAQLLRCSPTGYERRSSQGWAPAYAELLCSLRA